MNDFNPIGEKRANCSHIVTNRFPKFTKNSLSEKGEVSKYCKCKKLVIT